MNSTTMLSNCPFQGRYRHTFTVSTDAKNLNDAEYEQEYGNPDTDVEICSPELDCDTGSSKFER